MNKREYKPFHKKELINNWEDLIKMNREDVISLYEEWKQIEVENNNARKVNIEEKNKELKEISDFLKNKGIEVYKYKRKGFFTEKNGYQSWYENNIRKIIDGKYKTWFSNDIPKAHCSKKTINGIELYNNQSPTNIVELYDKLTQQYNAKNIQKKSQNKLLVKSIEYAKENNIDIENFDADSIISYVQDHASTKWIKEEVPNGTEIYLKHECSECSTYIMGERRCSCGNRRISVEVEGNIIDGFYYYTEPY